MEMLLEQFKTIFDRPEKVKQLRELILQLAVQGKLVPQDPDDEPASTLLEQIKVEKEQLIKDKKIKKEKALPPITEEEIPYELPQGWEWVRLGSLAQMKNGISKRTGKEGEQYPVIRLADIKQLKVVPTDMRYIQLTQLEIDNYQITNEDILIIRVNGSRDLVGRAVSVTQPYIMGYCDHLMRVDFIRRVNSEYFWNMFNSTIIQNNLDSSITTTAGQNTINQSNLSKVVIPLPPLQEQHRIVQRVDQLMTLCDQLESNLEQKLKYRELSSKSVFSSISNCSTSEEVEEQLKFILANFKDLTLSDNGVKELRNAILQLAVQGKLVSQDTTDETASVLIERIQAEKEQLIAEKKIRKEKVLPPITEEEMSFELPEGWEWVRLNEIALVNPRNALEDDMEVSFIPMKLIKDGFSNEHTSENRLWSEIKSGFTHFAEGDIVIAKITPCFENMKSAIMSNLVNGYGAGTTELYVVRPFEQSIMAKYILNICKTKTFIDNGVATYTGTAGQQRVKKEYVDTLVIALPPLQEQHRIIQKVDILMGLCEQLEEQINKSKAKNELLLKSILQQYMN